jgi:uncharacterized OB-fold protein
MTSDDPIFDELQTYIGERFGPTYAWDPVNAPMVRQWREALGFATGPADAVPAAMLPVWLMAGVNGQASPGSDMRDNRAIMKVLEREGYKGILGTNCEQDYVRPLRIGERIATTYEVETVSDRKQTKFGPGYFITFLQNFLDEKGDVVGSMRLRIVRFKPLTHVSEDARPAPPQPSMSQDTEFFWKGLQQRKLLIQRCSNCGLLRHPPGPACGACHSLDWDTLESSGAGEVYSFVVVHTPKYPAFDYPHPVGLIALDEGVRMIAPLDAEGGAEFRIGDRVQAVMQEPDEHYRLPIFRRISGQ